MPETIEQFVSKLQSEGVQAGEAAAAKIRSEADLEARRLIEAAEEQARQIIEGAKAESQKILSRGQTDLKLAARDTVVRLQETLSRVLNEVITHSARETLSDPEFFKQVLRDVIMQYVQADVEGKGSMTLNVSEQTRQQLAHWAIEQFHQKVNAQGWSIDLHGSLADAGFEYKVGEGTVEVTGASVVALLTELVGPELRRMIAESAGNGNS